MCIQLYSMMVNLLKDLGQERSAMNDQLAHSLVTAFIRLKTMGSLKPKAIFPRLMRKSTISCVAVLYSPSGKAK